ncbi:MAG TPA: hypothetical protein VH413_09165 [Verrucomicrobiae bacterium]|jgi:hypothetical protein|nr:hypothetical protein [Verrucomicrobiae bacterium]
MQIVKRIPFLLVIVHFVFAVTIFSVSSSQSKDSSGLAILVTIADYPASILSDFIVNELVDKWNVGIFAISFIYIMIGSVWYFLIGIILRNGIQKLILK